MARFDEFQWDGEHIRQVAEQLGYAKVEQGVNPDIEMWVLDGDDETAVQIPLKEEASDYQFLCNACINQMMRDSLVSVERMYRVAKTMISTKYPGI